MDDVHNGNFKGLVINEPESQEKEQIIVHQSTQIVK